MQVHLRPWRPPSRTLRATSVSENGYRFNPEPKLGVARKANLVKFGAGEGIRTLDPNLGKVVLYP